MIQQQQRLCLSPYMAIYDLVIPKDNFLRKINDLIDFSFVYNAILKKEISNIPLCKTLN